MKNILDLEDDPYMEFLRQDTPMSESFMDMELPKTRLCNAEEEPDASKRTEKKKLFYRDKMAQLLAEENYIKQEYNYNDSSHFEKGKSPISREEQLKRNRESAKNSRQRKKEYVSVLELKNEENQKIIEELNEKLRVVTLERDRLREFNHVEIRSFLSSKAAAYEDLSKVVRSTESSDEQIANGIESMLKRFGAAGTQRVAAIRYYMNEIVEILLSDIHKYFVNSSVLNQGFLSPQNHKLDMEVIGILQIDNIKVTQIMRKYTDRFNREAGVFKDLTQEFYRIYQSIENQARIIELVFNELCSELNSKHLGELILWFEENKFRRDIRKVRTDWVKQLMHGEKIEGLVRKHIKLEV